MTWLDSLLCYRTTKMLKVDYWQLGALYYAISIMILVFYGYGVFSAGDFLLKEPIEGRANPFASKASYPVAAAMAGSSGASAFPYCVNNYLPYTYSADFDYRNTDCEVINVYEMNQKSTNYISFTTVYTETQDFAWPCGASDAFVTSSMNLCNTHSSTTITSNSILDSDTGQCGCQVYRTVFPSAIEETDMTFNHGYLVTDLVGVTWSQTSGTVAQAPNHDLDTKVYFANNKTTRAYKPSNGQFAITFKLKDVLAMVGLTLETTNPNVQGDAINPSVYPTYRHTGLGIEIEMLYTNRHKKDEVVLWSRDVDVSVNVTLQSPSWTSSGPKTFFTRYPEGVMGSRTYHRIVRYPQDIEIRFVSRGYAYAFEPLHALQAFVDLVVLVGVAKTIMDIIVFNLLPNGISLVLKNKRSESTTRARAFAELGMKAALSVNQFSRLDSDGRGVLNLTDLTQVFGTVEHVDRSQALQIARTILKQKGGTDGIHFEEFMSITEGSAITFKRFLELVRNTAGDLDKISMKDKEEAMKAYKDVEQGVTLDEDEPSPTKTTPSAAASTPAPRPQPQLPPGVVKLACHQCKRAFGVPVGAKMVSCPHCAAVNNVAAVAAGPVQSM